MLGRYEGSKHLDWNKPKPRRRSFREWFFDGIATPRDVAAARITNDKELEQVKAALLVLTTMVDAVGKGVAALVLSQAETAKKKPAKRRK